MSQSSIYSVVHNVIHLQAKPGNDAERVSQARMGQKLTEIRIENGWIWAEGEDAYRGWADLRWLRPVREASALTWVSTPFADVRQKPDNDSRLLARLSVLSGVMMENETDGEWTRITLADETEQGWVKTQSLAPLTLPESENLGATAARWGTEFSGTPYLWGGSSSFGLDCSGFVQLCYLICGITLRRDADIQRNDPRFFPVERNQLQPGDLVFFGKPDRITHVGMHLEGNAFIHAAGGAGVIITEWGDDRYSPGYVDARRLDIDRIAEPVTRFEAEDR